jgi:hypothetical protein
MLLHQRVPRRVYPLVAINIRLQGAALGFEPRTSRSAIECSTIELYHLLWDTAVKSHVTKLAALQSIILGTIVNIPWYVRKDQMQKDLKVKPVTEEIACQCGRYKAILNNYHSDLTKKLHAITYA